MASILDCYQHALTYEGSEPSWRATITTETRLCDETHTHPMCPRADGCMF